MKRKALITGARPHPFVGPWVELETDKSWEFEGLRDGVRVQADVGRVRGIIETTEGERISVVAVEVAA
ncbi:hypothetical protein LCGC14_2379370 [marine sediment metagenome]|uniref:Uncharacterized protein n=1 Tax=marine sediment metagenome TaxID=412755 RepID=A0A0F9EW38_9ZZZZ